MRVSTRLVVVAGLALGLIGGRRAQAAVGTPPKRPNIVFVLADELRSRLHGWLDLVKAQMPRAR